MRGRKFMTVCNPPKSSNLNIAAADLEQLSAEEEVHMAQGSLALLCCAFWRPTDITDCRGQRLKASCERQVRL